jgi:DNA-binding beta-propeller fold protein YncE
MSDGNRPSEPFGEIPKVDLEAVERSIASSSGSSGPAAARFRLVHEFGRTPPGALVEPITLAIDAEDRLIVLDRAADGAYRVVRFSVDQPQGETLALLPRSDSEGILNPTGLALGSNRELYVCDGDLGAIVKFAPDGRWLETYCTAGNEGGHFSSPRDVDVADDGSICVADSFNDRVAVLRPDGEAETLLTTFANPLSGEANDTLFEPHSVCAGAKGEVFIADTNQHRVLRLKNRSVTQVLGGVELFKLPHEVRLSRDRRTLFVADQGGARIQRFDLARAAVNLAEARTGLMLLPRASADEAPAVGGDIDITAQGHLAMINPRRLSAVLLDFQEP